MHCSLDLETMGTSPGCVILSIGAVAFDPAKGETSPTEFYRNIDVLSCLIAGLRVESSTQDWWTKQDAYTVEVLFDDKQTLRTALNEFSAWYKDQRCEQVWANGPVADVAWMEAAYRAVGLPCPWTHRDPRCYRTIVELAGIGRDDRAKPSVPHYALDDARAQAIDICRAHQKLGR